MTMISRFIFFLLWIFLSKQTCALQVPYWAFDDWENSNLDEALTITNETFIDFRYVKNSVKFDLGFVDVTMDPMLNLYLESINYVIHWNDLLLNKTLNKYFIMIENNEIKVYDNNILIKEANLRSLWRICARSEAMQTWTIYSDFSKSSNTATNSTPSELVVPPSRLYNYMEITVTLGLNSKLLIQTSFESHFITKNSTQRIYLDKNNNSVIKIKRINAEPLVQKGSWKIHYALYNTTQQELVSLTQTTMTPSQPKHSVRLVKNFIAQYFQTAYCWLLAFILLTISFIIILLYYARFNCRNSSQTSRSENLVSEKPLLVKE